MGNDTPLMLANGIPSAPILGALGGRPAKGIIGWLNENTIIVIGAGRDGSWERFVLEVTEDGRRQCVRNGWKHYLGN